MEDIDWDKVRNFISKVNKTGRFQLTDNLEDSLKKLKLINNVTVSNAALLLFAKEEITYNVHVGRFKTPSLIIDDRVLRLSLFEAVEETMKRTCLQKNTTCPGLSGIEDQRKLNMDE